MSALTDQLFKELEQFKAKVEFEHNGRRWRTTWFKGLRAAETIDGTWRAVEQNPETKSDYATRARAGAKIVWFFDRTGKTKNRFGSDYFAVNEDGRYRLLHPGWGTKQIEEPANADSG